MPLTGGEPEVLLGGPRTVTGAAAAGGTVVATVADAGSAGEVLATGPGGERTLTGLRRRAGRAGGLAAAGGAHRDRAGRLPRARLGGPAGPGRLPGPRPVLLTIHGGPFMTVRLHAVRRGPGVRRRRLRGGDGQPARLRRLRAASTAGDPARDGHRRRGRPARPAGRRRWPATAASTASRVGVMGGSYGGYLTGWLAAHAGAPVPGGDRRAGADLVRLVHRLQRHRLLLHRGVRRRRPGGGRGAEPADARGQDRPAGSGHPLRARLALPGRAGAAAASSRCAPAGCRPSCCSSRARGTSCPAPGCRATGWPASRPILDWWARHLG